MTDTALQSLAEYSDVVTGLLTGATIERSTAAVWPTSSYTGTLEGEVFFARGFRLRVREELDFDAGLITSYGYEVYLHGERWYWYDDFPDPNDLSLASTFPHHEHIPPDIRRHRIPAPDMSLTRPNLDVLTREIEVLISDQG